MNEAKADSLRVAVALFRPFFTKAILDYENMLTEETTEVATQYRARWSKEEVMKRCEWPYPKDWRSLRDTLEREVGLIMYRPGQRWGKDMRLWTFATQPEDRERGIINAVAMQLGQMRRSANVMNRAVTPGDKRQALDENSKEEISRELEYRQGVTLGNAIRSLQDIKMKLMERETLELLDGSER